MSINKAGRRVQTAIPRQIRQHPNLHQGDRRASINQGNEVVLQPLKATLFDFRGSVPVSEPQDFSAIRQQVIDRAAYRTPTRDD